MKCCGAKGHPWDRFEVEKRWMPKTLRCLIIGENPGDVSSPYFYEPPADPATDPVLVGRDLLAGLHEKGLIAAPTLEAFRDGGFLFDHAIRCPLPREIVEDERLRAQHFRSLRVAHPEHLRAHLARASLVWVMGHVAANAVANVARDFPKVHRKISQRPFPGPIAPGSRYFVSEYFHRFNGEKKREIVVAFDKHFRTTG
jgi:hypothetical protein